MKDNNCICDNGRIYFGQDISSIKCHKCTKEPDTLTEEEYIDYILSLHDSYMKGE